MIKNDAGYDAVISVAAINSDTNVASFSQQTNQVELAAPGVQVQSTVPTGAGPDKPCRGKKCN